MIDYAWHWYDLDCLDHSDITANAIFDRDLAEDVASHKQHFFREIDRDGNVIDYQVAVSGALCLIPSGEVLDAFGNDYWQMLDVGLFQSDAVGFGTLMERLSDLQDRVNEAHI
ncbi:MAG: hypothetical protein OXC68_02340 [Aestuariivita sp.]|nr:hypothetical protein [Aestuariivita sp.]